MKTLNIGDNFIISKKALSNMLNEDRVDKKNVGATIKYFEEKNIHYVFFKVITENGNITFQQ